MRSDALRNALEFRDRLYALWRDAPSSEELVRAVQRWREQAEATGDRYLIEFSRRLTGYRLVEA